MMVPIALTSLIERPSRRRHMVPTTLRSLTESGVYRAAAEDLTGQHDRRSVPHRPEANCESRPLNTGIRLTIFGQWQGHNEPAVQR
jgi:hypothetical protein